MIRPVFIRDNFYGVSYELEEGTCPVDESFTEGLDIFLNGNPVNPTEFVEFSQTRWKDLLYRTTAPGLRVWTEEGIPGSPDARDLEPLFETPEEEDGEQ